MPWPLSQDYNEAIQDPASSFADPDLKQGDAATNSLGIPMPRSGNFADVYEVTTPKGRWAVKCFTRQIPGLRERYKEISAYLKRTPLPFMVDFTYLEQGIRVRGEWYPVLKMQWVEGFTLNQFVKDNLDKPAKLDTLCQIWVKLAAKLREAEMAHCDLQHGNVLLVPGSKAGSLAIKLVDYDGMCVPALTMLKTIEVGHPNFQHPQRAKEGIYSLDVDRFSHLVIYTAVRALQTGGKALWAKYDNGDNLLFKASDLERPNQSPLFATLLKFPDRGAQILAEQMLAALSRPLAETPLLEEVVPALTAVGPKKTTTGVKRAAEDPFAAATAGGEKKRFAKKGNGLVLGLVAAAVAAVLAIGGTAAFLMRGGADRKDEQAKVAEKQPEHGKKNEQQPEPKNPPTRPRPKAERTPKSSVEEPKYAGTTDYRLMEKLDRGVGPGEGHYAFRDDALDPHVSVSTRNTESFFGKLKVPPHVVTVHPGPTSGVVVAWRSPINGSVRLSGRLADLDAGGGDGIAWILDHRTVSGLNELARGDLPNGSSCELNGGSNSITLRDVNVTVGEMLEWVVLPKANHEFDLTLFDWKISTADGSKVWDITRDIAYDPNTAANPHDDRYGNRAVWHFYGTAASKRGTSPRPESDDLRWRIAGEWQTHDGRKFRFNADGTVDNGGACWFVHGRQFLLFGPGFNNAPGGAWLDYGILAADDRSFQGGNQSGFKLTLKKLKDQTRDNRPLPASYPADLVGSWELSVSNEKHPIVLTADGTTNQPQGRWFTHGKTLLLVQSAEKFKAGFWADILELAGDRRSATGRNLDNLAVRLSKKNAPAMSNLEKEVTNSIGIKLMLIPPGKFQMGSPSDEPGRAPNEGPQHEVTLSSPYYMATTKVTQAQFERIMGGNPSYFNKRRGGTPEHPVDSITWNDAVEFCNRLSAIPDEKKARRVYRLPTEAEWEYACRAGTTTTYFFGNDPKLLGEYAWYVSNSKARTRPVGTKKANPWGLYDMLGDCLDLCSDFFGENYEKGPSTDPKGPGTGDRHVARGGWYSENATVCRPARRDAIGAAGGTDKMFGFRVVLSPEEPGTTEPDKNPINLLKMIDPKKPHDGQWRVKDGVLQVTGPSTVVIPYRPKGPYELRLTTKRGDKPGGVCLPIVSSTRQAMYPGFPDQVPSYLAGGTKDSSIADGQLKQPVDFFPTSAKYVVTCTVQPDRVMIRNDNGAKIEWKPDWSAARQINGSVPLGSLWLCVWGEFSFYEITLIPLGPAR